MINPLRGVGSDAGHPSTDAPPVQAQNPGRLPVCKRHFSTWHTRCLWCIFARHYLHYLFAFLPLMRRGHWGIGALGAFGCVIGRARPITGTGAPLCEGKEREKKRKEKKKREREEKGKNWGNVPPGAGVPARLANVVGKGGGDDHGELHQPGDLAVAAPGGLVDHFVEAVFLDGVGV